MSLYRYNIPGIYIRILCAIQGLSSLSFDNNNNMRWSLLLEIYQPAIAEQSVKSFLFCLYY